MVESGLLSFGNVELAQEPGSGYWYSGVGYAVLQMVIEDVTGVAFDEYVKNEITDPLGATSLRWAWTPELEARAPTPYGEEGQPLEYRQLTCMASEARSAPCPTSPASSPPPSPDPMVSPPAARSSSPRPSHR